MRSLPVRLLRLSPATVTALEHLGLRTIGHLLRIPRETLPARFDKELLLRLDQLQGITPEAITPQRRPEPVEAVWETEHPVSDRAALEELVGQQLQKVIQRLMPDGQGVQELLCRFRSPENAVQEIRIELIRPTQSTKHLLELLTLQWERQPLPEEVSEIRLIARQAAAMQVRTTSLLETDPHIDPAALTTLIERLSSRLGPEAVLKVQFVPEEQPELAVQFVPALKQLSSNSSHVSSPLEGRGRVSGVLK